MCYYIKIDYDIIKIENNFGAVFSEKDFSWPEGKINGFSGPPTPAILNINPKIIIPARWGISPLWANCKKFLNCRIETAGITQPFKNYTENRCIIPVSGFYEWKHIKINGKVKKEPYYISAPGGNLMAFAGIYDNSETPTYTLMTTEANDMMAAIHDRMPVVLSKDEEKLWLAGEPMSNYYDRKGIELQELAL